MDTRSKINNNLKYNCRQRYLFKVDTFLPSAKDLRVSLMRNYSKQLARAIIQPCFKISNILGCTLVLNFHSSVLHKV